MDKRSAAAILLVILTAFGLVFYIASRGSKQTTPDQGETATTQGTNQQEEVSNCPSVSESENIIVEAPCPNDTVSSPLTVSGRARVFEATVNLRLRNAQGDQLVELFTMASQKDVGEYGPFETTIEFQTTSETGTLEVFTYSPKDGTEQDKVTIPLNFK